MIKITNKDIKVNQNSSNLIQEWRPWSSSYAHMLILGANDGEVEGNIDGSDVLNEGCRDG